METIFNYLSKNEHLQHFDAGSAFLYRAQVELFTMRTRDLRQLLLKKLGADQDDIAKIIDKQELRYFAANLIQEEIAHRANGVLNERLWKYTLIAIGISIIFLSRQPLIAIVQGVVEYFKSVKYQISSKFALVRLSIRNRLPIVCISLIIASALELVSPLMQMSVAASWILPSYSPLRRYLFPSLSIPVSADMLMSTVTGKKTPSTRSQQNVPSPSPKPGSLFSDTVTHALGSVGSMGINVGPMLTLMIVGFVKNRLENWAASYLVNIVEERSKRHESKRRRARDREFAERVARQGVQEHEERDEQFENEAATEAYEPGLYGAYERSRPPQSNPLANTSHPAATFRSSFATSVGGHGSLSMDEILRHGKGIDNETDDVDVTGVGGSGWDDLD